MASNLSIWQRVLRLVLTEKGYVLRSIRNDQKMIDTKVAKFESAVNEAHLSIASTIENLRSAEARQVEYEDRDTLLSIKIEGVGSDFQKLQNKKKHEDASSKAAVLEELIEEQVSLQKRMAENAENIKTQNSRVKGLRKTLNEMKGQLQSAQDKRDELKARYNAVSVMDKATDTMLMLESTTYHEDVKGYEKNIRAKEIAVESRLAVRDSSDERQFELLERSEIVQNRLAQYTTPQKGIE
ncbi:MAG: hypothetical protein H9W81_12320 [Enterococcus sp.]|nr:hypothetical protein [Enterococcus sp.]